MKHNIIPEIAIHLFFCFSFLNVKIPIMLVSKPMIGIAPTKNKGIEMIPSIKPDKAILLFFNFSLLMIFSLLFDV